MGWTTPGAKGTFRAHWRDPDGAHRSEAGFTTEGEAKTYADQKEEEGRVDARRGVHISRKAEQTPFRVVADMWKRNRGGARTTKHKDDSRLEVQVLPEFGEEPVGEITKIRVTGWVTGMEEEGYSKKYVTHCLYVLKQILDVAVDLRMLPVNPARGVKARGRKPDRKVALTPDEAWIFVRSFPRDDDRRFVLAALATGCRWGEISGIRRRSVDVLHSRVQVRPGDVLADDRGELYDSEGKNDAVDREIWIPEWGKRAFEEQLEHVAGGRLDRVFRSRRGGKDLRATNWRQRSWDPVKDALLGWLLPKREDETAEEYAARRKDAAGRLPAEVVKRLQADAAVAESLLDKLPYLTFHSLRHTAATWRAADGATIDELMKTMGWSDIKSAQPYFGHALDETRRKVVEGLQQRFAHVLDGKPEDKPAAVRRRGPRRRGA